MVILLDSTALSVVQMKCWDDERVVGTIEPALGDSGDLWVGHVEATCVGIRVMPDHVAAHIVCPFNNLGPNVGEERL